MKPEKAFAMIEKGEISTEEALSSLARDKDILVDRQQEQSLFELAKSLEKLNSLVGLKDIKNIIHEHLAFMQIQRLRKEEGLKNEETTMHMAFLGNPGTGKTTVARVIGDICQELKYLDKGHLVEIDRSDLVGEYIGHTAQKTKKVIQKALGGILFIDEAYSLCRVDERDFGQEAIDILVKEIEDKRHKMILIVAGYIEEMKKFLKSNPGLSSRIPLKLVFPDYNLSELMEISRIILAEREYRLTYDAREMLRSELRNNILNGNCSNGRLVRNILEKSFRRQAARLINKTKINRQDLLQLTREDLSWEENRCIV